MKKSNKRRVISGLILIGLCVLLLVGGTYAWFTDSVRTGKSRVISGSLDVELYYKNAKTSAGTGDGWQDAALSDAADPPFFADAEGNEILWRPGTVSTCDFEVRNEGNLALSYTFQTEFTDGNDAGIPEKLSDVIRAAVVPFGCDVSTRQKAIDAGNANGGFKRLDQLSAEGILSAKGSTDGERPSDTAGFTVVLYWEPNDNVDNDFNMKNENAGKHIWIDVDVRVVAIQYYEEADTASTD